MTRQRLLIALLAPLLLAGKCEGERCDPGADQCNDGLLCQFVRTDADEGGAYRCANPGVRAGWEIAIPGAGTWKVDEVSVSVPGTGVTITAHPKQ